MARKKQTMPTNEPKNKNTPADQSESGQPGGGAGRTDEPGRTGVWPGSGPYPPGDAPVVPPGPFGRGERGGKGYEDSGTSSLEGTFDVLREQKGAQKAEQEKTSHSKEKGR